MSKRGRPSRGLSEARVEVRAPSGLVELMARVAQAIGISTSEAWRRAAKTWLGAQTEPEKSDTPDA